MAFIGNNPKFNTGTYTPQSTVPSTPTEGMTYYDDGTNRAEGLYVYKNGQWTEVGSGSAGINYIENGNAEAGTTGWAAYADVAGVAPVDGSGGSPTTTLTATTSSPLRGVSSLLITKDAANRQGEGASYDFTVDTADQAKVLRISFDVETSANFADGDIRVYVYDVTNSVLIEVVDRDLQANANGKYIGEFQTASNSTSYRLILHVSSTNATAYTVKFDNVQVGPRDIAKGSVQTDPETYTPTFTGFGTPSGVLFTYARDGKYLLVEGEFVCGTTTAVTAEISLPSGLVADGIQAPIPVGRGTRNTASTSNNDINFFINDGSNTVNMSVVNNGAVNPIIAQQASSLFSSGQAISLQWRIPIQGWSANSDISTDFGNREVYVDASGNAGDSITADVTNVPFVANSDSTSSWSGSVFTVPETGRYSFNGSMAFTTSPSVNIRVFKNGSSFRVLTASTTTSRLSFSAKLDLVKGDTISFRTSASVTLSNDSTQHYLGITKTQSPQTLIGSETVACSYGSNNGQTVTNGSNVLFEDIIFDTHGAYDTGTGIYTVPQTGKYMVVSHARASSATSFFTNITQNGTDSAIAGHALGTPVPNSILLDCVKGDTIALKNDTGGSVTLSTQVESNRLSIYKI